MNLRQSNNSALEDWNSGFVVSILSTRNPVGLTFYLIETQIGLKQIQTLKKLIFFEFYSIVYKLMAEQKAREDQKSSADSKFEIFIAENKMQHLIDFQTYFFSPNYI